MTQVFSSTCPSFAIVKQGQGTQNPSKCITTRRWWINSLQFQPLTSLLQGDKKCLWIKNHVTAIIAMPRRVSKSHNSNDYFLSFFFLWRFRSRHHCNQKESNQIPRLLLPFSKMNQMLVPLNMWSNHLIFPWLQSWLPSYGAPSRLPDHQWSLNTILQWSRYLSKSRNRWLLNMWNVLGQ